MRTLVERLRARWTAWRNSIRLRNCKLRSSGDALILERGGDQTIIPWNSIVAVDAFKRDCYTVDSIRLLVITSGGLSYELAEHHEGWEDITCAISENLPGCLAFEEWFFEVAFPAFETNLTRLYPPSP